MYLQERTPAAYCHGWLLGFIFKRWGLKRQQSRVINPKGKPLCLNLCSLYIQYSPKSFFRLCKSPEWVMNTLRDYIVFLRMKTTTTVVLETLNITATVIMVHALQKNCMSEMLWRKAMGLDLLVFVISVAVFICLIALTGSLLAVMADNKM